MVGLVQLRGCDVRVAEGREEVEMAVVRAAAEMAEAEMGVEMAVEVRAAGRVAATVGPWRSR